MQTPPAYAVIDLETTGFGPSDRIIEVGVVLLDSKRNVERTWETLIQPNRDIPNTFVHHLSASDLVDAPYFGSVASELADLLHGRVLVAHNANFEVRFLSREFDRLGVKFPAYGAWVQDTMRLFGRAFPGQKTNLAHALHTVGLNNDRPHTALADAQATAELFAFLFDVDAAPTIPSARLDLPQAKYPDRRPAMPRPRAITEKQEPGAWLSHLADSLPVSGERNVERYRAELRTALADKVLVATEIRQLEQRALEDGLSREDVLLIHEEFVRQLAIEAWLDGIITDDERATLMTVGQQLGVEEDFVASLLSNPQRGDVDERMKLAPGDRVTFTGQLDLSREEWEKRARAVGLDVGGVTKKSKVLVAANPDSQSGKARKARSCGVPIVGEKFFAQLIHSLTTDPQESEHSRSAETTMASLSGEAVSDFDRYFPWLGDAAVRPETPMDVAKRWIEQHASVPLLELSPALRMDNDVDLNSGMRVDRRWLALHPQPLLATVDNLRDLQGVGELKVSALVERVVLAALDSDIDLAVAPGDQVAMGLSEVIYAEEVSASSVATEGDDLIPGEELLIHEGWVQLSGARESRGDAPAEIAERTTGLMALLDQQDPVEFLFARAVAQLVVSAGGDARKIAILHKRWLGDASLDELGAQFDVTRERIRQLEVGLRESFDRDRGLFDVVVSAVAARVEPIVRVSEIQEALPALVAKPKGFERSFNDVFAELSGKWKVRDGWAMSPEFPQRLTRVLGERVDEYGVAAVQGVAADLGIDRDLLEEYIERDSEARRRVVGEHVLTQVSSHQDRAVSVLAVTGAPMTVEEIMELLGGGNKRSISNQFSTDPRMVKVSQGKWALESWGMEEFRTISDWIGNRIDASEETVEFPQGDEVVPVQAVALSSLLGEAERLEVSESSIRMYAGGAEYQVVDGMVIRRVEEWAQESPRSIEETRDMVWRDGQWNLLLTVTADHLRGSGFAVGTGLGTHYGLKPNTAVALRSRLGEQMVRMNRLRQVQVSTIKRFLDDLNVEEGERVYLRFGDDGLFDVTRAPEIRTEEGLARVYNALGISRGTGSLEVGEHSAGGDSEAVEVLLEPINEALGLKPGAARRRSVAVLRHRRQDDLADIVQGLS